jgi:sugar phosphate isomerase/epimerase
LAAIRDTGVRVFDLEIIRLDRDFAPEAYLPFFETGAKLSARSVLVAGDDDDESRLTDSFARACEAAAPFGLSMDLEFMPQTKVSDVRAALRVLEGADQPNSALIVDALHFARSRSSLDDAASIPPKWMNYLQICDAPPEIPDTIEGLNHTARCERLLPGEGGLDLEGLFSRLPRNLPISVEVPNDKRAPLLGPEEWARQALEATKATLARVPGYQDVPAPMSP